MNGLSGEQLALLKKKHDLRNNEIGRILEMSEPHISRCLNGHRNLSRTASKILLTYLKENIHEFIGPKNPDQSVQEGHAPSGPSGLF